MFEFAKEKVALACAFGRLSSSGPSMQGQENDLARKKFTET